jgi:quaternary ammonium compound-resistance protein SugE
MAWILLSVAGLLEVCWASLLKQTDGFTRTLPTAGFAVSAAGSLVLLALALRALPVGTAYAVWTGIGAVGTAAMGIFFMAEPATATRVASVGAIVVGIVGLRVSA